jgi:hypothetical protein
MDQFGASFALTMLTLFTIGARATISNARWWQAGLEMLSLGTIGAAAFMSGSVVAALVA